MGIKDCALRVLLVVCIGTMGCACTAPCPPPCCPQPGQNALIYTIDQDPNGEDRSHAVFGTFGQGKVLTDRSSATAPIHVRAAEVPATVATPAAPLASPTARLTYPQSVIQGATSLQISTGAPVVEGGTIAQFRVSPELPEGLSLQPTTGAISGTPTQPHGGSQFTVEGLDAEGRVVASTVVTIIVHEPIN